MCHVFFVWHVESSQAEVEGSPVCPQKYTFIPISVGIVVLLVFFFFCIVLLTYGCCLVCKRSREKNCTIESLGLEMQQVFIKKMSKFQPQCDEMYKNCVVRLYLLMLDICKEKKLPERIPSPSVTHARDEPDGAATHESCPVLDNIPPEFHSIILSHCTEFGISLKDIPNVRSRPWGIDCTYSIF